MAFHSSRRGFASLGWGALGLLFLDLGLRGLSDMPGEEGLRVWGLRGLGAF